MLKAATEEKVVVEVFYDQWVATNMLANSCVNN